MAILIWHFEPGLLSWHRSGYISGHEYYVAFRHAELVPQAIVSMATMIWLEVTLCRRELNFVWQLFLEINFGIDDGLYAWN